MAENLASSKAFTLFVTHYPQLIRLAEMYSNVKNYHFRTTINLSTNELQKKNLDNFKYLHSISEGPCDMSSGYGIILAETCGFPEQVLENARVFQRIVRNLFPILVDFGTIDEMMTLTKDLLQRLLILRNSRISNDQLRGYLENLRSRYSPEDLAKMQHYLSSKVIVENIPSDDACDTTSVQSIISATLIHSPTIGYPSMVRDGNQTFNEDTSESIHGNCHDIGDTVEDTISKGNVVRKDISKKIDDKIVTSNSTHSTSYQEDLSYTSASIDDIYNSSNSSDDQENEDAEILDQLDDYLNDFAANTS